MAIYLETNALRKLTDYKCKEPVYTTIFSIFELLSGMSEKEFIVRKTCLEKIKKQKIEIRGPMIDKVFGELLGNDFYNQFAYKMITDIYQRVLKVTNYSDYTKIRLSVTDKNGYPKIINASSWLKEWDNHISGITQNIDFLFSDDEESREYIKSKYKEEGINGLAKYYFYKMFDSRIDETKLSHAEAFAGLEEIERCRQQADNLFNKYNYRIFMTAQAAIFAEAHFINGGFQNKNNASDLLHLLYLNENDKFVSNDKIYQKINEACPECNFVYLDNEKSLSELLS